jgi:hypothetical protein
MTKYIYYKIKQLQTLSKTLIFITLNTANINISKWLDTFYE